MGCTLLGTKKTGNNPWYTHYWEQNYWIIGMHIKKQMKPPPSGINGWYDCDPLCVKFLHEDWGGCRVDDLFVVSVGLCKGEITKKIP